MGFLWAWFPEDIDRDGDLTFFDVSAYNAWFNTSDPRADFARPWGTINFFDQSQFQGGFNSKERGSGGIADEGPSGTWNRIGYAGSVWDPVAGLWLSRHRHYEPEAGRWLTPDPAGYVDGLSLYLYVRGNPITLVDPTGLTGEDGDDNLVMRVLRSVFGGDDDRERSASAAEGRPAPGNPGRGAVDEAAVRGQMQEMVDETRDLVETGYSVLPGGAAVVTGMHLAEGDYAGAAEYAATEGAINLGASATLGFVGGLAKPVVKQVGKGLESAGALRRLAGGTPESIQTPYDTAVQEISATALRMRSQIQEGAPVYKGGVLGRSETGASQFLAIESPLNSGYAGRYGLPPQNANFDFIMGGRVRSGAPIITRSAPGIPPNPGGGIEGVVDPGSFQVEWFHMP